MSTRWEKLFLASSWDGILGLWKFLGNFKFFGIAWCKSASWHPPDKTCVQHHNKQLKAICFICGGCFTIPSLRTSYLAGSHLLHLCKSRFDTWQSEALKGLRYVCMWRAARAALSYAWHWPQMGVRQKFHSQHRIHLTLSTVGIIYKTIMSLGDCNLSYTVQSLLPSLGVIAGLSCVIGLLRR